MCINNYSYTLFCCLFDGKKKYIIYLKQINYLFFVLQATIKKWLNNDTYNCK